MRKKNLLTNFLLVGLSAGVSLATLAQSTVKDTAAPPKTGAQSTPVKAASWTAQDKTFASKAAQAGHAEVEAGKIATSRSSNPEVKKFAEQMITDHSKAGQELEQISRAKGVTLPAEPDAAHKKLAARLQTLEGPAFDRVYISEAGVKDHAAVVKLFQTQTKNGKDAELKGFAEKTLPTIQHHEQMAKALAGKK